MFSPHTLFLKALTVTGLVLLAVVPVAAAAPEQRIMVGFEAGSTLSDKASDLQRAGVKDAGVRAIARSDIAELNVAIVDIPLKDARSIKQRLRANSDVAFVEIDHIAHAYDLDQVVGDGQMDTRLVSAKWIPNDAQYTAQWSLEKMRAAGAWDFNRGAGVKIAVVDTGVDYIHPDLQGKVLLGRDYVDDDQDPMDVQGHGTHVAGIAAALSDNGEGIAGVAPQAQILAIRVLDGEGSGNYSWVANGIVYAANNGAKVINLSLGGPQGSRVLQQAIDYASAKGAIVMCASGNEASSRLGYPARYNSCVSVGASNRSDRKAAFSNAGTGLDLVAPGSNVLSSVMDGGYEAWSGTSMATPNAAGVAAILVSQGLSRRDVISTLKTTAVDLGSSGYDTNYGYGRIDAWAAAAAASRLPRATADTEAPYVTDLVVGAVQTRTRRTFPYRWVRNSRTKWRRIGATRYSGTYSWKRVSRDGRRRVTKQFLASRGNIYRRDTVHLRVRRLKLVTTKFTPVTAAARDDNAVDRIALDINGRTVAVDWRGDNGWRFRIPCRAGTFDFTAWAYDSADNERGGRVTETVKC